MGWFVGIIVPKSAPTARKVGFPLFISTPNALLLGGPFGGEFKSSGSEVKSTSYVSFVAEYLSVFRVKLAWSLDLCGGDFETILI